MSNCQTSAASTWHSLPLHHSTHGFSASPQFYAPKASAAPPPLFSPNKITLLTHKSPISQHSLADFSSSLSRFQALGHGGPAHFESSFAGSQAHQSPRCRAQSLSPSTRPQPGIFDSQFAPFVNALFGFHGCEENLVLILGDLLGIIELNFV